MLWCKLSSVVLGTVTSWCFNVFKYEVEFEKYTFYHYWLLLNIFCLLSLQLCDFGMAVKCPPNTTSATVTCDRLTNEASRDPHIIQQQYDHAVRHPHPDPNFQHLRIFTLGQEFTVQISTAADVYGFGVVMTEVASCNGHPPGVVQRGLQNYPPVHLFSQVRSGVLRFMYHHHALLQMATPYQGCKAFLSCRIW